MNLRYLLALAAVPAIAAVAQAQGPVEPPPPPTPSPSATPPAAPLPAPTPAPAPAPANEMPAAPAPLIPAPPPAAPAPAAPGDDTLSPNFASAPEGTLSDAPEAVNGELPPEPGHDSVPTVEGPVGLLHMSTAEVGSRMQLRMGLVGRMFSASDFLIKDDRNMRIGGALSVGFTPMRFLEVFGTVSGSANRNRRLCKETTTGTVCNSEAGRNDPEVIKSYGDISLGTKFAYPLSGGVSAGGELGVRLLSSVSGISFNPDATSVWLTGLSTWDMRDSVHAPLRLHLDLGLYFDNSDAVQSYKGVSRPSKAVSQFAYGIAKDRVRGATAVEGIFVASSGFQMRPFVEYHLEIITATPDPTFSDFRPPACKTNATAATDTPCRDNRDQQWLTLGARGQFKNNFAIVGAVDVALHSVGFPYGPPLPPFEVSLGVAYPFDLAAPRYVTRTVVKERRIAAEKPVEGYAVGKVVGAPTNTPVEGAIVSVAGRSKSRVATDPDGTFKTAALPVGLVDLEVSAPGFVPSSVRTSITAGQEAPVSVTLTPKVKNGKLAGKVTDPSGKALAANVHISGPQNADLKTDDTGAFSTTLPSGAYVVRIEAEKFATKELKLEVTDGQEQDASASLRSKTAGPSRVSVNKGKLSVRGALGFTGSGSSLEVNTASAAILDELAEVLNSHPEIRRVRIEAHWDTSLPKEKAQQLTEQQAKVVAAYLSRQGVASDRLQVVGMGAEKPVVPNIGMAKMRNRRVEIRATN